MAGRSADRVDPQRLSKTLGDSPTTVALQDDERRLRGVLRGTADLPAITASSWSGRRRETGVDPPGRRPSSPLGVKKEGGLTFGARRTADRHAVLVEVHPFKAQQADLHRSDVDQEPVGQLVNGRPSSPGSRRQSHA